MGMEIAEGRDFRETDRLKKTIRSFSIKRPKENTA